MLIISFERLYKIHICTKLQRCGLKIEPTTLISKFQSSKLKRMWQAQFFSYTLVTLRNNVSFKDVKMILISFFDISKMHGIDHT